MVKQDEISKWSKWSNKMKYQNGQTRQDEISKWSNKMKYQNGQTR